MRARSLCSRAATLASLALALGATAPPALPDLGPSIRVGHLPAGGTSIVAPLVGAPVAVVELWFRVPSAGFGTKPKLGLAHVAAQTVAGSQGIIGTSLGKLVADLGGRLAITVFNDSLSVSATVPAPSARTVVKAMTTAYFAPIVSQAGYERAERDVAQSAVIASFDAEAAVRDAVFATIFAAGPEHDAPLGDPHDVAAITFDDVQSFATRGFRSQNATLVVSGAVDPEVAGAAVAGRSDTTTPDGEPATVALPASANIPVTRPFLRQSGGYGWAGPPIANEREATAMDFIADYLFRPNDGRVSREASALSPQSFIVGQFITLHDPGVLFIAYTGPEIARVKAAVDAGLAAIAKPLPAADFSRALTAFDYHLASDLQTPVQVADDLGWYTIEGNPAYAPGANGELGAYQRAAHSLTPDFVAAVAVKYLGVAPVAVTLAPPPGVKIGP